MIDRETLETLVERARFLAVRVSEEAGSPAYAELARDYAALEPIAHKSEQILAMLDEQTALESMVKGEKDRELAQLAGEELDALSDKLEATNHELTIMLLPRDEADERNVIVEIRAGTGGDEAGLFAGDLFRMYTRHAQLVGWKVDVLSEREGVAGGYKEIIMTIAGKGVYGRLKFESGVHRVQRVPETEASGRIHTSAATVAVMPEAQDIDITIDDKDLKIDVYRASGAGGQHVNKTESAVRITHLPTGIVVAQQDERSQHRNRDMAMKILRARLFEKQRDEDERVRAETRKSHVGSGDRSERIRTYNVPQGRLTDHRIGLTLYKLEQIMMGVGLDEVIDALLSDHQAQLLAAANDDKA